MGTDIQGMFHMSKRLLFFFLSCEEILDTTFPFVDIAMVLEEGLIAGDL